jgi:hypothetical protein
MPGENTMLRFTSYDDLSRLKKTDPAYLLIRDAIQSFSHPEYNPEEEGFVVLIEPDDLHRPFWGEKRGQAQFLQCLRPMPRRPRIHIDGLPLHIVQRGHNRAACFVDDQDRRADLGWLHEALGIN